MLSLQTKISLPMQETSVHILYQERVASGLKESLSGEPLVSIYPDDEFPETYHLRLVLYLLDSVVPQLNEDFNTIERENTEAGLLEVRQITVAYNPPADDIDTYSIWLMDVDYVVKGPSAQAIRVKYTVGDPVTSRGTVTTVKRTLEAPTPAPPAPQQA